MKKQVRIRMWFDRDYGDVVECFAKTDPRHGYAMIDFVGADPWHTDRISPWSRLYMTKAEAVAASNKRIQREIARLRKRLESLASKIIKEAP